MAGNFITNLLQIDSRTPRNHRLSSDTEKWSKLLSPLVNPLFIYIAASLLKVPGAERRRASLRADELSVVSPYSIDIWMSFGITMT